MTTITQIEQHFLTNDLFPGNASVWRIGKPVYEFPFIQKLNENAFIVHSQRHISTNPFQLAEKAEWTFTSLKDAFQKWKNLEDGIF